MALVIPILMFAQAASGPYQLARADVQACGAMAVERNERAAELARRNAAVEQATADLNARQAEVQAARAAIDQKNKQAVAQFNQQVDAANALRAAVQPQITARDQYVQESNALTTTFNAKCAHRDFNPADLAKLPEAQRAALSGKVTTRVVKVPAKSRSRR